MIVREEPRPDSLRLPVGVRRLIVDIDSGKVLGASRQLGMIGDAMICLAQEYAGPPAGLSVLLGELVEHLVATRGASSQAITNGLHLMSGAALDRSADEAGAAPRILDGVHAFRTMLAGWLDDLQTHGAALLPKTGTVLAYDYSSSVAALLRGAAASGADLTVVIPEARSLNGGQKYLQEMARLPVRVRLIPDAAISWALRETDSILVGAETMSLEGGCYNTIGTELLARLAAQTGTPFHVISILLKVDRSAPTGGHRAIPLLDFAHVAGWDGTPTGAANVDCSFPDLDYTAPHLITSIATERGVLTPDEFGHAAEAPATFVPRAGTSK